MGSRSPGDSLESVSKSYVLGLRATKSGASGGAVPFHSLQRDALAVACRGNQSCVSP